MPRNARGRPSGGSRSGGVKGYILRDPKGGVNYVGIPNNPGRRAGELRRDGKHGAMKVETPSMSRLAARRWETSKLDDYRRNHSGRNPRHNQPRTGGWNR